MLERPGDLIPVLPNATAIPWTRRRSQILNFLHRGPVTFATLVYDTNVGDISALATYFNPDRISERELNLKFGQYPTSGEKHASPTRNSNDVKVPRLLLYPDNKQNANQVQLKVQRTLNWVLSQDSADSSSGSGSGNSGHSTPEPGQTPAVRVDTSMPPPATSKPFTMPATSISSALDTLWTDKGDATDSDPWPGSLEAGTLSSGLGLGQLATRVNKAQEVSASSVMDPLERKWGIWGDQGPAKRPGW